MNCFCQGFYNLGARMLLTIFQLKFHSKEVTFPGRSLHRGWHRNFRVPLMFKEALFSGAVVTPTARAKSQCKHAGKGAIQRQKRRRMLDSQTLTDIFRENRLWTRSRSNTQTRREPSSCPARQRCHYLRNQRLPPFAHWCCYVKFSALIGLFRRRPAFLKKKNDTAFTRTFGKRIKMEN